MKSKKIPTYLKYYLSKTRLDGLVFNKTYLENLSGISFYLDHSIEDKIKINFKASESTQDSTPTPESPQEIHVVKGNNTIKISNSDNTETQTYPLSLGNLEMCNINNYADAFFKNVPECVYYDNTLEVGKWYKYGRIGKTVLDGSENWTMPNTISYSLDKRLINNANIPSNTLTNYIVNSFTKVANLETSTIGTCWSGSSYINFNFDGTDDNLNNFKEWLNENNIILYYILTTPTKKLLSDTLQEELDNINNNAHTYDKITNIGEVNEDRPFILDISYYRKVK